MLGRGCLGIWRSNRARMQVTVAAEPRWTTDRLPRPKEAPKSLLKKFDFGILCITTGQLVPPPFYHTSRLVGEFGILTPQKNQLVRFYPLFLPHKRCLVLFDDRLQLLQRFQQPQRAYPLVLFGISGKKIKGSGPPATAEFLVER